MVKHGNKEKVLVALLETRSVAEASVQSGISAETIYRYLRDKSFESELKTARRAIVEIAISALQQAAVEAVRTLTRNMSCENPALEVRSSQIILEMTFRGIETIDILDRLQTLEHEYQK
jgi:predicted DNA-binding transcriptional regulator AlpA